jgi:hypothetical protein
MPTLNIAEIEDFDGGEIVPRLEGKVVKVWEQRSGEGAYGQWWLQNLVVKDGTGEITVT